MVGRDSLSEEYILVPIVTMETLKRFLEELDGYNSINFPLLTILPNYYSIWKTLYRLRRFDGDDLLSIFTSKNGVNILLEYLGGRGLLESYSHIFNYVACIGPSTRDYFLENINRFIEGFEPIGLFVPEQHTSTALSHLVVSLGLRPILWASRYVDEGLRDTVLAMGGLISEVYDVCVDWVRLRESAELLSKYKKIYLVYMSVKALDATPFFPSIGCNDLYGVFISPRVYRYADTKFFKGCYVYEGDDIEGFYRFVRGVLG